MDAELERIKALMVAATEASAQLIFYRGEWRFDDVGCGCCSIGPIPNDDLPPELQTLLERLNRADQ